MAPEHFETSRMIAYRPTHADFATLRKIHTDPATMKTLSEDGSILTESGLSPLASSGSYGVAFDDPATTPAKEFRFDICGSVSKTVPANRHGIVTKTIPRGRCAVVRHEGSVDQIAGSVYHLYRKLATAQRRGIARLSDLFPLPEPEDQHT